MHEAKTHLSPLVEEAAAAGASFVICKAGRPMVRVTPLHDQDSAAAPRRRVIAAALALRDCNPETSGAR
ncbi:MAG: type II toxin-antitoxin system Phd/YefM family antitoxin [Cyanobium sp.]